ncbi:MAG: hypothetical protein ACRDD7_15905, partial [Peptostreptococcaceae bacterium]
MSEKIKYEELPKESKSSKNNIIVWILLIGVVLGIIINYFNNKYIYNDIIANNIFIENVDVSQMTKEEAVKVISNEVVPESMYLSYEDKKYEIAPSDINLKYNVNEVVIEAYNYTKTDNY